MRPTIAHGLRERSEDPQTWADREAIPALKTMRSVLNQVSTQRFSIPSKVGVGAQILWTSEDIPADANWITEAWIQAKSPTDWGFYLLRSCFTNIAGTVTARSTQVVQTAESDATLNASLVVNGKGVGIFVVENGTALNWTVAWRVWEATGL